MRNHWRTYEEWQELILDTLGDREMSTRELWEAIVDGMDEDDEYLVSQESVYNYCVRMCASGVLSREPTGLTRPKWRYFKSQRPVTGDFAAVVAGVELESPLEDSQVRKHDEKDDE
jgi:hypothetical protein